MFRAAVLTFALGGLVPTAAARVSVYEELEDNGDVAALFAEATVTAPNCAKYEALKLYQQAEEDFRPLRIAGNMSAERAAAYANFCRGKTGCMRLAVQNGQVFVLELEPGFQSRHQAVLHAIFRVAYRFWPLHDAQIVVDLTDGDHFGHDGLPVFTMTKKKGDSGILYPDFTFFSWPESVCPGERSHAFSYLESLYAGRAANETADLAGTWREKRDQLFWRGAKLGDREKRVQQLSGKPNVDVSFMAWTRTNVSGQNAASGCVTLIDHCQYRYLAYLPGRTYSSQLKYLLLCGSCVLAEPQEWLEWWSGLLEAGKDFLPVSPGWEDAWLKLNEVRASPDGGRAIGERAREKMLEAMSQDAVDCFWRRLLEEAAAALPPPPPALLDGARPIEDVLLFPLSTRISGEQR